MNMGESLNLCPRPLKPRAQGSGLRAQDFELLDAKLRRSAVVCDTYLAFIHHTLCEEWNTGAAVSVSSDNLYVTVTKPLVSRKRHPWPTC